MEREKVKEIKEYLQEEVFIATKFEDKLRRIPTRDLQKILTIINELESENETLRNAKVVYETVDYCYEDLKKAEKRIAELEEDKEKWQRKAVNYYQMAKSYGIECIIDNDIDETLKEFIND